MKRLRWGLIAVVAAAVAVLLASGVGSVFAARKQGGEVICKLVGKHKVSCPKGDLKGKRGKRGKRGKPGPAGPAGPAGPGPSAATSGLNLNFNAYLTANKTKELTVGNFTVTAASDASGKCVPISLRAGTTDSRVSIGSGGVFATLLNNKNKSLTDGSNSNMFTAVTENGSSTISGIVGSTTAGGVCLVSGYVTGL